MHRTTTGGSSSSSGLFKGGNSIFSSKTPTSSRPTTSSGSPTTNSDPFDSTASRPTLSFSRKPSISKSPKLSRNNSFALPTQSPEKKRSNLTFNHADRRLLPVGIPIREEIPLKSADSPERVLTNAEPAQTPGSGTDSFTSTTPYSNMLAARPSTGYASVSPLTGPQPFIPQQPQSPNLDIISFQHIQETSSKRISTLDYLRKAHEGRVYWFNTLLFNKSDLQKLPYFDSRKLARRATNYLILGLSLPTVIDLSGSNAFEFLKTMNALLAEFESFQQIHPPDGSSSLSRGRFPQMFKRTATGGKGRRSSSAAEIGLPMGAEDSKFSNGTVSGGSTNSGTNFSAGDTDLLPGEEYTYLLTPSLPFDPDFYETFATLCDVLIDCYTKTMSLASAPKECNPVVAEMFTKADARIRKIIVQGVVKEFEDSSRGGVKGEVAGVGRVVLGGLM